MSTPEFIVYTGPMFGSKTTRMLAAIDRYSYQNKRIVAFKPSIDDRYDDSAIVTHSGGKLDAICVSTGHDVLKYILGMPRVPDVIAVDEAFMIQGIADALIEIFARGITIVVSSLDLSSSCNPFNEIEKLMCWSTRVEKCPAVCPVCGADAFYTFKKVSGEEEILIGGADIYEPRCWNHHPHFTGIEND